MNGYEKAQALGLSGTTAENVAVLQTLTDQPIPLADLLFTLNFRGMLTKVVGSNETEKWRGSILVMKAAIVAASVPPENATEQQITAATEAAIHAIALDQWLSHITNPRNLTFDTTNPLHAATFAVLNAVFGDPQVGIFQAGDFDAVYALGGGRPYADLTVELYSSQKEAAETAQAKAALVQYTETRKTEFDAAYNLTLRDINNGQITTEAGVNDSLGVI